MNRSFYYVCFLVFLFSNVKASKVLQNTIGYRLKRALYGVTQNISYHTDPNRSSPGNRYNQSNWSNQHGPTHAVGTRPQNLSLYNTNLNRLNSQQTNWNNPSGQKTVYNQNTSTNIGWKPQDTYGYNTKQQAWDRANPVLPGSHWNNSNSQWNNPSGGNYHVNLYNPNDNIRSKPQNTTAYNNNAYGHNSQQWNSGHGPTNSYSSPSWNNHRPQGYSTGGNYNAPNDLMIQRFKRFVSDAHQNISFHSNNRRRSHWNFTKTHNYQENLTHPDNTYYNRSKRPQNHSRHQNITWYNTGFRWNRHGSHNQWKRNNLNKTFEGCPHYRDHPRDTIHYHHHHFHRRGPRPNFVPPPPPGSGFNGTQFNPPPPEFNPSVNNPLPPGFNNTIPGISNGSYPLVPKNEVGSNTTQTNGTEWGLEIPDLNEEDLFIPDPQ